MHIVFPAHAGMSPGMSWLKRSNRSFPRTRGDEPSLANPQWELGEFSPHTRG